MKKLTLMLFTGLAMAFQLYAGQGGPDQFGYIWIDNQQPGGPVYQWINNISPEARVTGLGDDNIRGPYPISTGPGNMFKFYWYPVDQLWIGSNGYIAFNPVYMASTFPNIPDSNDNKNNFIAALLSDLTFAGVGNPGQCYLTVDVGKVIISFVNVPFYSQNAPSWAGSNTFQIILDKTDNSIIVNYQSQTGTPTTASDVKGGIENVSGTIGLKPFSGTYPTAGYTIKYIYPPNSSYLVRDGAVKYNSVPYSKGLHLPYPTSFSLKSDIANLGNLVIPPPFNATGAIRNTAGANTYFNTFNFTDTLYLQEDSLITFSTPFIPAATGTYSYTTRLYGIPNDLVAVNDSVTQELVVVDTSQLNYELAFCDNTPDLTGIAWIDGTGGVGMYFRPPSYPVAITTVQFYITSNANGANCYIKIFDDNGPDGGPGTLLDSTYVIAPSGSAWKVLTYSNPVVINSGGFYVGWEMGGLNITMGVDRTPPISHRAFEIINGIWSEYRDALTQDFMIKCTVQKTQFRNIGASAILNPPANATLNTPTQISCRIRNFGNFPATSFQVRYQLAGMNTVSQFYNGPAIQAGDSIVFNFTVPLLCNFNGNTHLCVWTDLPYDFDLSNDTSCIPVTAVITVGMPDEEGEPGLNLYPNPFDDYTYLESSVLNSGAVFIEIRDLAGRLLRESYHQAGEKIRIERGSLPAGVYCLRIHTQDKQYFRKLVAE